MQHRALLVWAARCAHRPYLHWRFAARHYLGLHMPHILTSLTDSLKHLCQLFIYLALPCLLGGCGNMIANGMVLEQAVAYPMRSPEYVLRDLGDKRYLLAQWDVPLNANEEQRVRYFDRNTGVLTPLPETVSVFRHDYMAKAIGALRYESDSPLAIAFFTLREPGGNSYCEESDISSKDKSQRQLCGEMDIVLSLDGGRSFGWRRIRIPASMGRGISARRYEFVIVRDSTLYFGMYVNSSNLPKICCYSTAGNMVDGKGVTYARRFKGVAVTDSDDVFLGVLAMPLPDNGGKPLPAEQIPKKLSADFLSGQALLDFKLGQPMARLATPIAAEPKSPKGQYKRADREAYIESLRAQYPTWAAHQTLDDIPRREQWMSLQERNALRAKQPSRGADPVEWVRFDSPASQ